MCCQPRHCVLNCYVQARHDPASLRFHCFTSASLILLTKDADSAAGPAFSNHGVDGSRDLESDQLVNRSSTVKDFVSKKIFLASSNPTCTHPGLESS